MYCPALLRETLPPFLKLNKKAPFTKLREGRHCLCLLQSAHRCAINFVFNLAQAMPLLFVPIFQHVTGLTPSYPANKKGARGKKRHLLPKKYALFLLAGILFVQPAK